MSDKSEFQKLRDKIARYLRRTFLLRERRTKKAVPATEGEIEIAFKLEPDVVPPTAASLDATNIASYRDRIDRNFAEAQTATTPWIKLGVDLGTSSSKVVWRGENTVYPVCFRSDPLSLESYFEPSLATFQGKNILFGFEALSKTKHTTLSNFKMCLACAGQDASKCNTRNCSLTTWPIDLFCAELQSQEIQFINATHLAKLIGKAKTIITSKLRGTFRRKIAPKWTANLAVPETFIEQSPVADEFRRVLRTAWLMSDIFVQDPKLKDRHSLFECFIAARDVAIESLDILKDEEFGCSIYPEVGAEVASIVMSRLSEEGLYAFVDIGAGTVDVSFFNYYREDGKPNRPPYAASISTNLGAAQIELRASKITVRDRKFSAMELKKIKETYNGLSSEEQKKIQPQYLVIKHVIRELKPRIQAFLQDVFREARDEKDSHVVNEKIRLVIGGGGSHLNLYKNAAIEAFTLKHRTAPIEPEVTVLQKPDDFHMTLPEAEFHRFSVAYGLSYPIDALPKMIFAKDVLRKSEPKKREKDFGSMYEK